MLLFAFVLRYLSVALHEAGHWAALQLLNCRPVMGFTGLIQSWTGAPPHPEGWISIAFEGDIGYIHLSREPAPLEWAASLAAGLIATLFLAWAGVLLAKVSSSPALRVTGWVTALVNGLGILLFPLNYWYSKGDTAFLAHFLELPEWMVALVFEAGRGGALLAALGLLPDWKERLRWSLPVLGGYLLTLPALFALQRIDRTLFLAMDFGATHLGGFPWPVLLLNLCAFLLAWKLGKDLKGKGTPEDAEVN